MSEGIDAHCHLNMCQGIEEAVAECRGKISAIVTGGIDFESVLKNIELARKYPGVVYATAGFAPEEAQKGTSWQKALELAEEPGVVAVGEIGLDRRWGETEEHMRLQRKCFNDFLEKALEKKMPVVVHSRKAEEEVMQALEEKGAGKVLMHCFSGKIAQALECAERGYLISVPPVASKERKKIARQVPLESLLLESDAPFLGRKPIDIITGAQIIAGEKGIAAGEVIEATARNAKKFFEIR